MYLLPEETRIGYWIPWDWELQTGLEPGSSRRATSALLTVEPALSPSGLSTRYQASYRTKHLQCL
ncbi:mCG147387 [Mus musculus]|nr:mCG147387 [Mus musculus]